ncbi:Multiple antibiotic resistance protein MarA [compost metagenome]
MKRAKLYIRDNLAQALQLKDVANYLNVSERHLSRLFSEGIHESFTNYIRGERIRQAAHLLLSSDLPIKEIAEMTGFSSVHYFTRTFLLEKKIPPGRFRQKEKR